ncbi:MAG: hypothetical protein V2B19_15615 [Pseudomonadota bacterium]
MVNIALAWAETGNYLTATGRTLESDWVMLKHLGMMMRERG